MKHVLITGGAGFIGSRLAKKIVSAGLKVTVLDNLSPQIHANQEFSMFDENENIICIKGDVRDKKALEQAFEGVDAVVHLAAETGTGQSMYEVARYTEVNIQGTALLLECIQERKECIKKMVVASSRAIFGEGAYQCNQHGIVYPNQRKDSDMEKRQFEPTCPTCNGDVALVGSDENTKVQPSSIYGITKQVQEQMFMLMGESLNVPACAMRYQNVYGPGQSLSNPYTGILSIFSTLIRNEQAISIFEDGLESRDFVYVDDIVAATFLALTKAEANQQVFNIGSGIATTVIEVINALFSGYKKEVPTTVTGNYRVGDIRHNYADITKATNLLGFTPKVSFDQGIADFCQWVMTQDKIDSQYENSINEMKARGLFK
jgi:dTDP-L-rhamnose 4-epimerase